MEIKAICRALICLGFGFVGQVALKYLDEFERKQRVRGELIG
jgi:hypothetical protein